MFLWLVFLWKWRKVKLLVIYTVNAMRKIIHIDMDCFFAAVEMREDPALAAVPLAIGGAAERRGVIATCNYVARRFGVRSAMATFHARRLCPELVLLPGRMALYQQVSRELRAIFARYTPLVEPMSLDEAYLDVTGSSLYRGSATLIAEAIRADIQRELGLTASAGVAPNKFLAKIASDLNKPDGLFVLPPEQVSEFVARLPLKKIPGIGEKTAERLVAVGLHCGADVLAFPAHELLRRFGKCGQMLLQRARGIDERPVEVEHVRKSVGVEVTLPADLHQWQQAGAVLHHLQQELQRRLARHTGHNAIASQGVKLKFSDFTQTCVERRSHTIEPRLLEAQLQQAWLRGDGKGVRLVGIVAGLQAPEQHSGACQLTLGL